MSRRDVVEDREESLAPPPSRCAKVLYYTWKLCSLVFSHFVMISLVVAYCILGAVTFERLEADHEREVKRNISQIRGNTTHSIWRMTQAAPLLNESNWTSAAVHMLKDFENAILLEMKVRGWDGNESTDHIQWTFTGALFYSIIVITTIGYGHIAPKTQTGKVVTIFYAILGIPLMLLCLSNIGDVMASSFRFLYWRVCCYVCTRPPKRRSHRPRTPRIPRTARASTRRSVRCAGGAGAAGGGSARSSTRRRRPLERAHSDTDCRYRDSGYSSGRTRRPRPPPAPAPAPAPPPAPRFSSQPPPAYLRPHGPIREYEVDELPPFRYDRYSRDARDDDEEDFPKISLPLRDLAAALKDLDEHKTKLSKCELRSKSLPRPPKARYEHGHRGAGRDCSDRGPYDLEDEGFEMHDLRDVDYENYRERKALEERGRRRKQLDEEYGHVDRGYDPEDDDYEFDHPRGTRPWRDQRRVRSEYYDREPEDFDDYGTDAVRPAPGRGSGPEWGPGRGQGRRARSAVQEGEWRQAGGAGRGAGLARGRRLRRLRTVDDSVPPYGYSPSPEREDWSDEAPAPRRCKPLNTWGSRQFDVYPAASEVEKEALKPVPIWLCVCLVASYIVVGTFLFKRWEGWPYLDAAYFCFITLTTIGFGDFVPAQGSTGLSGGAEGGGGGSGGSAVSAGSAGSAGERDAAAAVHSIALCSLYLLFGIALLAMSFNLVQEEVRANVAALATKLGIIKPPRDRHRDSDTD